MTTIAEHELFALDGTETEAVRNLVIHRIHVRRLEGGKFVYVPKTFEPGELQTRTELYELFGGGDYMIEARDADNRFGKSCRFQLPGASKPLTGPEPPAPAVAVAPATPSAMPPEVFMVAMLKEMMQASQASTQAMMQMQQASQAQNTQLLIGILNRGEAGNSAIADRRAELEREAAARQHQFLTMMLERAREGSGGEEQFMKGMEFMQGMVEQMQASKAEGAADGGGDDLLATLVQVLQGFSVAKGNNGAGAGPAQGNA